jgi:formylglycine-generating enzyme required for sulfatase activity
MRHAAVLLLALAGLLAAAVAVPAPGRAPAPRPARPANYTEEVTGTGVRFDMVGIPGGTFRIGSPAGERGRRADEGPQRLVKLRPFWMGKTEVTWDEYDLFLQQPTTVRDRVGDVVEHTEGPADAITGPSPPYPDETHGFGREGHPVVGISHHAAMEYCRWLSRRTGRRYRLPTEAEWEFAARAGAGTAYFFGEDATRLGEYAWCEDNSGESTHPVGKKRPNPWGLYDVYGNVAEWCLDHYQKDRYTAFPAEAVSLSPVLVPTAAQYSHVARGGSWADAAAGCRSAARRGSDKTWNRIDPGNSIWWVWNADFVGFRVVRAVEEQPELRHLRSGVTRSRP